MKPSENEMKHHETHEKPDENEIASRLRRLRDAMSNRGLGACVLTDPANILWLTNFANIVHERPFVLVVLQEGDPVFVVPRLELDHVESRTIGKIRCAAYREFPAPAGQQWSDVLLEILISAAGRVGIEPTMPNMVANIVGSTAVTTSIVEEVRAVKSAYECARIRYACRQISQAHAEFLSMMRDGLSQTEVNATVAKSLFGRLVADDPNINPYATQIHTLFQNALASHDPHNFSDLDMTARLGGPHVSVFNAVLNGYGAEIERTFFLGFLPNNAKKPFEIMMEARALAFELTKPGEAMSDVDRAVSDLFVKAGYEDNWRHRTGHGMGVTAHEGPFLADGDDGVIVPGMVFTIEPGLYLPGVGGFRHSDTVLVANDGLECLTQAPHTLDDLVLGA